MDGKDYYYVGKTRNFYIRMEQHIDKQGAAWLKQFPQDAIDNAVTQQIDGEIDDNSSYKEMLETLKLMVEHGVRYVRGAEYCEVRDYDANDANRIQYAVMHHLGRTDIDVVFQGLIQGIGDVPVASARPLPAAPTRPLPPPSPTARTNGGPAPVRPLYDALYGADNFNKRKFDDTDDDDIYEDPVTRSKLIDSADNIHVSDGQFQREKSTLSAILNIASEPLPAPTRPLPAPTRPLPAPVRTLSPPTPSPTARTNGGGRKRPRSTSSSSSQRGYCILCAGNPRIMNGSFMRYCNPCYENKRYVNPYFRERFCNNCGTAQRSPKLSYNNPRCKDCQ
mgnify:FL=1